MNGSAGRKAAFAAGVAAALGFGGTQALAAPGGVDTGAAVCENINCERVCASLGAIYGTCAPNGVTCTCYWVG